MTTCLCTCVPTSSHRLEGVNARWIIAPPEFAENSCENITEISSAISLCEPCVTSTNYQCHLETVEVCLSRLQELEEYRVSVLWSRRKHAKLSRHNDQSLKLAASAVYSGNPLAVLSKTFLIGQFVIRVGSTLKEHGPEAVLPAEAGFGLILNHIPRFAVQICKEHNV
jgi:hypothetical protein